jgi:hypothetical protein
MLYKDILTKEQHKSLYDLITGLDFPWYYQPNIAYTNNPNAEANPNLCQSFGLTHTVWDIEKGKVSEVLSHMAIIADSFTKVSGIKPNNFIRIKINLQTPVVNNDPNKYNGAHVDRYTPHCSLIYYLDDSDGDTFIFNELFDESDPTTWPQNVVPTVKERITPVANSLYHLDTGLRYHSSSNPINTNRRYTINFNFN